MGINLRYGPMDWDKNSSAYDFGGSRITNFVGTECYGTTWYVCGRSGANGNNGLTPRTAFATIQHALNTQISHRAALATGYDWGDRIVVFPSTYVESLTGTMTNVEIIGIRTGGGTHLASIRPTASYSYTGSMTDSAFRNLLMMSPSTTNTEYAAIMPTYMGYSAIENCFICGRAAGSVVGIQIGTPTDNTTEVKCDYSSISGNHISTFYANTSQFAYGIQHSALTVTNMLVKQMHNTVIANNRIEASTAGIALGMQQHKSLGSVIRGNMISSQEDDRGPTYGIRSYTPISNQTCFVIGNYIKAVTDCISQFEAENVMGNFVSTTGGTPVRENPDGT